MISPLQWEKTITASVTAATSSGPSTWRTTRPTTSSGKQHVRLRAACLVTDSDTSYCRACQLIGGGAFTLNQIIDKSALKFTKGEHKLKKYTHKGDSGMAESLSLRIGYDC